MRMRRIWIKLIPLDSDGQKDKKITDSVCLRTSKWREIDSLCYTRRIKKPEFFEFCVNLGLERYGQGNNANDNLVNDSLTINIDNIRKAKAYVHKHSDSPKDCQKLWRPVEELYRYLETVLAKDNRPLTEKQKKLKELDDIVRKREMERLGSGSRSGETTDNEPSESDSEMTLSI
jgi:hypothetical protein